MKNKFLSFAIIVLSITIILLTAVQLTGYCDQANYVFVPLSGMVLLLQAIQYWKVHRTTAVFSLCASLFIFGVSIFIIFF